MSFGATAVRQCRSLRSWDAAREYFTRTPQPKGKKWNAHERPLYNNRSWHYRVEQHGEDYHLCLYHTPLIKYEKPKANGDYTVRLIADNRTASRQFMWLHGWSATRTGMASDGQNFEMVMMPGSDAVLTFNAQSHLILEQSNYTPCNVYYTTPERKQERKEMLKKIEPYRLMLKLREMPKGFQSAVCRPHHVNLTKWFEKWVVDFMDYCLYHTNRSVWVNGVLQHSINYTAADQRFTREILIAAGLSAEDAYRKAPMWGRSES